MDLKDVRIVTVVSGDRLVLDFAGDLFPFRLYGVSATEKRKNFLSSLKGLPASILSIEVFSSVQVNEGSLYLNYNTEDQVCVNDYINKI